MLITLVLNSLVNYIQPLVRLKRMKTVKSYKNSVGFIVFLHLHNIQTTLKKENFKR